MNLPVELQPLATAVGWTLLHFVWQGALVGLATALGLTALRRQSAEIRYVICCAALAVMIALPILTFLTVRSMPATTLSPIALAVVLSNAGSGGWQALLRAAAPWVSVGWLAGVWIMQIRLVMQLLGARALRVRGLLPLSDTLTRSIQTLAVRIGLRRTVAAYESTVATVPMVVGWLRPVVLVPTSALTGLDAHALRAVLAHELAHVRRHDALVNLVQTVFESLFFFHPAVWWLSDRLRNEREFCCDDVAVETCGDTLTYARALASLDELREVTPPALAATGGSLMHRITRLFGVGPEPTRMFSGWIAPSVATLALTAAVSAMTLTPVVDDDEVKQAKRAKLHAEHVSLSGVDVVEAVQRVDPEQAESLAQLRALGLDDDTLFAILLGNDPDPELVKHIYAAAKHAEAMGDLEQRMEAAHAEVRKQVEAGEITEEQAKERLMGMRRRVEGHALVQRRARHDQDGEWRTGERGQEAHFGPGGDVHRLSPERRTELHERMTGIEERIKHLKESLAAGEITEEQAKLKMAELKQHASMLKQHGQDMLGHERAGNIGIGVAADPEAIAKHLLEAREHVQRALSGGHITPEQAQSAFEAIQLHEHQAQPLPKARRRKADPNAVR